MAFLGGGVAVPGVTGIYLLPRVGNRQSENHSALQHRTSASLPGVAWRATTWQPGAQRRAALGWRPSANEALKGRNNADADMSPSTVVYRPFRANRSRPRLPGAALRDERRGRGHRRFALPRAGLLRPFRASRRWPSSAWRSTSSACRMSAKLGRAERGHGEWSNLSCVLSLVAT